MRTMFRLGTCFRGRGTPCGGCVQCYSSRQGTRPRCTICRIMQTSSATVAGALRLPYSIVGTSIAEKMTFLVAARPWRSWRYPKNSTSTERCIDTSSYDDSVRRLGLMVTTCKCLCERRALLVDCHFSTTSIASHGAEPFFQGAGETLRVHQGRALQPGAKRPPQRPTPIRV